MPAADFAAAQARLEGRRQHREADETARRVQRETARAATTSRVPWPFRSVGDACFSVWDSIKGREGTRPAFRVGQVDAELLDEELLDLLKGQVGEALKYYGVRLTYKKLSYDNLTYIRISLTYRPTMLLRSYLFSVLSSSSSQSGTTMPRMEPLYKAFDIPMPARTPYLDPLQPEHKRLSTA